MGEGKTVTTTGIVVDDCFAHITGIIAPVVCPTCNIKKQAVSDDKGNYGCSECGGEVPEPTIIRAEPYRGEFIKAFSPDKGL